MYSIQYFVNHQVFHSAWWEQVLFLALHKPQAQLPLLFFDDSIPGSLYLLSTVLFEISADLPWLPQFSFYAALSSPVLCYANFFSFPNPQLRKLPGTFWASPCTDFLLLCMSGNLWLDTRHYKFYLVVFWIYFYKYSWCLLWDAVKLLRNGLILFLCLAFKIC